LQTRVTGVLRREDDDWKIVHLHFSVGVPDEEAIQQPR
jgi:ketosteroid isomerase-like protein